MVFPLKKIISRVLRFVLPECIFRIISTKPRLKIVDSKTANTTDWLWNKVWQGDHHRDDCDLYLTRKYGHIVDKGLQNLNRERGRSDDIAKKLLSLIGTCEVECPELYAWAKRIANDYKRFQDGEDISAYYDPPALISEMDTFDLSCIIKSRRSIRFFENRDIDSKVLEKVFEVVNWAPNSCNRQAIKIFAVKGDGHRIEHLMSLNSGATCMNTPPLFLTFCYDSRGLVLPTEREVAYIDVGLGMQNVILMAHAAGVATCVLNWTHAKPSDELSLRNELGIDDHHIIVANMVMGYSLKGAPVPMRSGINDFLYWR